jgi:diguanylate cyclase (GGDEF)-like protein
VISDQSDELVVAVVDDDDLYREYLSKLLGFQDNWRILEADSSASTMDMLDRNSVDCVLLDYNMGVESGLAIGETIRRKYPDPPPIIMLSGEGRDRTIVKAFRGGFSDFVSKRSLNTDELLEAIRGSIERKSVERIEKAELTRLARLANFDSMTGLHGYDFIRQRAEELSASATRRGGSYGAIIIRVQEMTGIVDAFGNIMRDRALQSFAARIKRFTREADICGRFAEDSFLYLVDRDATPRSIWSFCERLSSDLAFEANFEKASFTFATNMGMAMFPRDGATAGAVIAAASLALTRAREHHVPFAAASAPDSGGDEHALANAWGVPGWAGASGELNPSRDTDRRRERRHRVVKQGKVITADNKSVIDCRIRDISENGARLSVNEYYAPPESFTLLIVGNGERRSVKVRWRIGHELGVQFDP